MLPASAGLPKLPQAMERLAAELRQFQNNNMVAEEVSILERERGEKEGLIAEFDETRRQLEEEGDLDPRDDDGDGGATCRRCTRPKATFKDSRTFVGQRGHRVVTAPAQELTRRARQQSAR